MEYLLATLAVATLEYSQDYGAVRVGYMCTQQLWNVIFTEQEL